MHHSSRFLALVTQAKQRITEITPQELKTLIDTKQPLVLIDVREKDELSTGSIPASIHMSKGIIERDIEHKIPDLQTPMVVYCSGGMRCALVAENLQTMGYTHVSSLDTGLKGWIEAGYRVEAI